MAKCDYCQSAKGKRVCPGLDGQICSKCCGEHQRREIACPAECSYLRQGASKDAYNSAVGKLLDAVMSSRQWCDRAAEAYFRGDREMDEWEQPALIGYFAYGFADERGERFIERFVREESSRLRGDEIEALEALRLARYSLYEVQTVRLDEGLALKDLVLGDSLFVREKSLTHQVEKFSLLLGWAVELGDHFELTGSLCVVPRAHRDAVQTVMKREVSKARKASPQASDAASLRATIPQAQETLRRAVNDWRLPQLVTMDGEDIVF